MLAAVGVKGCGVSGGMLMNGSVVTSQVQLPLCRLNAASSSSAIIPRVCYVCVIYTLIVGGTVLINASCT